MAAGSRPLHPRRQCRPDVSAAQRHSRSCRGAARYLLRHAGVHHPRLQPLLALVRATSPFVKSGTPLIHVLSDEWDGMLVSPRRSRLAVPLDADVLTSGIRWLAA